MKTLVISDTHLDLPFEEKKFKVLNRIISQADKVIINGDFWEGFLLTFEQFYHSDWRNLFPLLKSKNTVYVFGNHDAEEYNNPEKLHEFSDIQTSRYEYAVNGSTFIFEHGHRLLPLEKEKPDVTDPQFQSTVRRFNTLEKLLIQVGGPLYQYAVSGFNTVIKNKIQVELLENEVFFCGHTHTPELNLKRRFINSGVIKYGLAQYLLIDETGTITARQERY